MTSIRATGISHSSLPIPSLPPPLHSTPGLIRASLNVPTTIAYSEVFARVHVEEALCKEGSFLSFFIPTFLAELRRERTQKKQECSSSGAQASFLLVAYFRGKMRSCHCCLAAEQGKCPPKKRAVFNCLVISIFGKACRRRRESRRGARRRRRRRKSEPSHRCCNSF